MNFEVSLCDRDLLHFIYARYYDLVDTNNGILKRGREIFLTGCYLRTASEGSGRPRLLPTEYLVMLLDEVIVISFFCPVFFIMFFS